MLICDFSVKIVILIFDFGVKIVTIEIYNFGVKIVTSYSDLMFWRENCYCRQNKKNTNAKITKPQK